MSDWHIKIMTMNYKEISRGIENQIEKLFEEIMSGIFAREDSRAFGAMIEKRITKKLECCLSKFRL